MMNRISSRSIQPILSLLDEGLLIYRRHFFRFVLIAALWIVPTAIVGGLIINAMAWTSDTNIMLIALAAVVLLLPLMLYTLGSLSRAAHAAISGQAVLIGHALRIPFRQLLGMSAFVIVYGVFMYIITSSLFIISVSYTHLDVYKRQPLIGTSIPYGVVGRGVAPCTRAWGPSCWACAAQTRA